MRSKKGLLGYYNYTVILTYIGMLVAFFGIALVLEGEYCKAVLCLMVAGACDMFDGAVASTRPRMPKERRFGVQIDSLCDLICFGVLPALMVYILNGRSGIALVVCSLYVLCALIRLAYFNVLEEERQDLTQRMETLRVQGKNKTVQFKELMARKLVNQQLRLRLEQYGLP